MVRVLDGAHLHRFAEVGIVGEADDGDALEPFVLEGLEELCPDQDQALDQRLTGVALLGGLEGPVEVVEDVDELEEQALTPLVEAAVEVLGDALAVALVLGAERPVRGEDLGEPVLGESRPAMEGLGGVGTRNLESVREPGWLDTRGFRGNGQPRFFALFRAFRPAGGIFVGQRASTAYDGSTVAESIAPPNGLRYRRGKKEGVSAPGGVPRCSGA